MPKAIRNEDPPQSLSESPELHREALQPKTPNGLKRSLDDDGDRAEEPLKKRTVRSKSLKSKIMPAASVEEAVEEAVDEVAPIVPRVTGHYAITISPVTSHHKFDTSSYTLSLFYHEEGDKSQLYANFKFDHLEGIMRLLPEDIFNAKGDDVWSIYDFIAYCKLSEEDRPSLDLSRWLMRWRGKDGWMRLDEKVGGEPWNVPASFNFKFEDGDEIAENGVGLRFSVVFAYDCKLFSFCGTKVRDLDPETEAPDVSSMEKLWDELDNPAWYVDEDAEPEIDPEPQSDSMFDLGKTPMTDQRKGFEKPDWDNSESDAAESSSPIKGIELLDTFS